jgi:hypothetical protein
MEFGFRKETKVQKKKKETKDQTKETREQKKETRDLKEEGIAKETIDLKHNARHVKLIRITKAQVQR